MANVVTRGEQLAAEIRRGCEHAATEADTLVALEGIYKNQPSYQNLQKLEKQRRRLSHALLALNGPIRLYHELLNPDAKFSRLQRFMRWLGDLGARGATFRGQP